MTAVERCARSRRVDGDHSWRFDEARCRRTCLWCDRSVCALTGRVFVDGRTDRPKRVQMSRQRPWRAGNPDAVVVARPSGWGNPYRVGAHCELVGHVIADRAEAVAAFRLANGTRPPWLMRAREELAGRDLACWCPLDQPCHADVLLELCNPGVRDA